MGQALATQLDCPFYEADEFHSAENVAKMANGLPLNDAEWQPWLAQLALLISDHLQRGETAVLACSVLKKQYRDQLRVGSEDVIFVYLRGSYDLIWGRLQLRTNHYMKAGMLQSQFDILEEPDENEALQLDSGNDVSQIMAKLIKIIAS